MSIWFTAGGEHDEQRHGDTLVRWWEWLGGSGETGAGVFLDKLGDLPGPPPEENDPASIAAYTGDRSTRCPMNNNGYQGMAVGWALWGDERQQQWRYAFRFYVNSLQTEDSGTVLIGAIGLQPKIGLYLEEDGTMELRGVFGGAQKRDDGVFTLSTGGWHTAVLWYDGPNAEGKCWVDDEAVLEISDPGNELEDTLASVKVYHGVNMDKDANFGMVLWVDDCVFNDVFDGVNDWGAVATPVNRVYRRAVDGDGDDEEWSGFGDAADKWKNWDETNQPDDDTTYNYVEDTSEKDILSTLEAHGLTEDDTLVCVVQYDMDKAAENMSTYKHLAKDGGSLYTSDPGLIGASYVTRNWFHNKRPSGTVWTKDAFDAFQIGCRSEGESPAVKINVTVLGMNIVGYFTAPEVGVRRIFII